MSQYGPTYMGWSTTFCKAKGNKVLLETCFKPVGNLMGTQWELGENTA